MQGHGLHRICSTSQSDPCRNQRDPGGRRQTTESSIREAALILATVSNLPSSLEQSNTASGHTQPLT